MSLYARSVRLAKRSPGDTDGFSLVELVVVVMLFGVMIVIFLQKGDSVGFFKEEQGIRRLLNTWQFAFQEAASRGESYRLVLDLDRQSYWVLKEIQENPQVAKQVDYLRNLRSKKEQARRDQAELENLGTVEEELARADERDSAPLEHLYYEFAYRDPFGKVRLARPVEAPSLADPTELPSGVRIRDVKLQDDTRNRGQVVIRFQPQGAADFALVHIEKSDRSIISAMINPTTGSIMVHQGDIDYEWNLARRQ